MPEERHTPLLEALSRRDLVGLELECHRLGLGRHERELLVRLPELRGGPEVLDRAEAPVAEAVEGLRACTRCSPSAAWPTG